MKAVDAWPGLRRAAACGPFFELVRWDHDAPAADDLGWHPMTDFAEHPLGLTARVNATRDSLSARGFGDAGASPAVIMRVAASVAFLGVAARLLSPAMGSVVTAGVVPELSWHRLHWRPAVVGVLPLAIGPVQGRRLGLAGRTPSVRSDSDNARSVVDTAIGPVLRLGDVVADRFLVSRRVVAGNVASAAVGAVLAARAGWPMADAVQRLVTDVLADGELAGTGGFVRPSEHSPGIRFRRRSCCLLYRVEGAACCGDCVLHDRARSVPGAAAGSAPAQQQDAGRYRHQQDRHR